MWLLFFLGLGAAGVYAYDKYALPAKPAPAALPPPSRVTSPGPIPSPSTFVSVTMADGTVVAAFDPDTVNAMLVSLQANPWRVLSASSSGQILTIAPTDATNATDVSLLTALETASTAGFNAFADADFAQKLSGASAGEGSATFIALSKGIPTPDPATDDGVTGQEQVATSPADATAALDPSFNGSRFVLFVPAGTAVA